MDNLPPQDGKKKKQPNNITVKMYKRKAGVDVAGFVEFSVLVSSATLLQLFVLLSCRNHLACHFPHTGTRLGAQMISENQC